MAIIDPVGLFGGDRLRRCSNAAQLHWPRLFLASDGFARLEINYARIIGRAYPTFNPVPSETELQSFLQEYAKNYLLFLYQVDGRLWGQWDSKKEMLPRYKTSIDRRSPIPPEPAFSEWKRQYRIESSSLPKSFGNFSETFLHGVGVGVGVGVGKNICASPQNGNACVGSLTSIEDPPFSTLEPEPPAKNGSKLRATLASQSKSWFQTFWAEYFRLTAKKAAEKAFNKRVKTDEDFQCVMKRLRAQKPEMLARDVDKRPYPATWLNAEDFADEQESTQAAPRNSDDYPEFRP